MIIVAADLFLLLVRNTASILLLFRRLSGGLCTSEAAVEEMPRELRAAVAGARALECLVVVLMHILDSIIVAFISLVVENGDGAPAGRIVWFAFDLLTFSTNPIENGSGTRVHF
jgi:hypothetical protein